MMCRKSPAGRKPDYGIPGLSEHGKPRARAVTAPWSQACFPPKLRWQAPCKKQARWPVCTKKDRQVALKFHGHPADRLKQVLFWSTPAHQYGALRAA